MSDRERLLATIVDYLEDSDIEWEHGARRGEVDVTLPGEKKLKTVVSLVAGESTLFLSAFVIRNPDENHEAVYRSLLRRNLRAPGVSYAVDASGDVYITGRVPAKGVDAAYLDQLLGIVLDAADRPFNDLLALGFRSSMQKEWDWRILRGEPLRNLEPFRHLLDHHEEEEEAAGGRAAAGGDHNDDDEHDDDEHDDEQAHLPAPTAPEERPSRD